MKLITDNIDLLKDIKKLFGELPGMVYQKEQSILNGATPGQHFRHILEFYICLIKGVSKGEICYDERERNELIESRVNYAANIIDEIIHYLSTVEQDKNLVLRSNYSTSSEDSEMIPTSLHRELAYALDHTVHHLALVKIALSAENITVHPNFGVAPSTIRHRQLVN